MTGVTGVIVVGAINVDLVVVVPELPGPGETVVGAELQQFGGGKGANAAVAASRLGASVHLIGAVGHDDLGANATAELVAEGVDVAAVRHVDAVTGAAIIAVSAAGENQIAVGAGANLGLQPDDVSVAVAALAASCGWMLVSTEIAPAAVAAAVITAQQHGLVCIINPAPVVAVVHEVAMDAQYLTPNQTELADLAAAIGATGSTPEQATFVARHYDLCVIVTLGEQGALIARPDGSSELVSALPAVVVDTTGAGDTFNGALLTHLARSVEVDDAVRVAVAAASLSVEAAGARSAMPTTEQLRERTGP